MWNPSICECQCDMWCKPGQYLDHKNCVSKNKLVGRVIEECTSIINETMINNKDNNTADFNAMNYAFIGFFLLTLVIYFACLLILSGLKVNILITIKYILIIIKMSIKSLKIKNQSYYYWNDIIYIDDFDIKYQKEIKENLELR